MCTVLSQLYCNYRQDAAKRQTAGIKFTRRPKIRFFAPQGRLVAPIHVKLGRADGHVSPLGCATFHLNRHRGWESAYDFLLTFYSNYGSIVSFLRYSVSKNVVTLNSGSKVTQGH